MGGTNKMKVRLDQATIDAMAVALGGTLTPAPIRITSSGVVPVANATVDLIPDVARNYFFIQNRGNNPLYVEMGGGVAAATTGRILPPLGPIEIIGPSEGKITAIRDANVTDPQDVYVCYSAT